MKDSLRRKLKAEISLRPNGRLGRFAANPPHKAGDAVCAKYSESSRTWKRATVVSCTGSHVTLAFDGYSDTAVVPTSRVKVSTADDKTPSNQVTRQKRRPPPAAPAARATQLPKASTACERTVAAARACLSKLAPGNFDKITSTILELDIDSAPTLTALVSLMFERAVSEPAFAQIYAKLFARCAAALPPCAAPAAADSADGETDDGNAPAPVTFRRLLLSRAQAEFDGGITRAADAEKSGEKSGEGGGCESGAAAAARKRHLGSTVFVGQLWKAGLLSDAIVHGCVSSVLHAAQPAPTNGDAAAATGAAARALCGDAVEVACTLLGVVGSACDASADGRARMDGYVGVLRGWVADKARLPARLRFKVMDLLDARKRGWHA